jgi:hypothetical protein
MTKTQVEGITSVQRRRRWSRAEKERDSIIDMSFDDSLPDDIDTLKQLVRRRNAELAQARAEASSTEVLIWLDPKCDRPHRVPLLRRAFAQVCFKPRSRF